jgi:hypothetical protein
MYNKEDITFELIGTELTRKSRTDEVWKRWIKRGFTIDRINKINSYWECRFDKDNASKNFISSVWKDWLERNNLTLEEHKNTIGNKLIQYGNIDSISPKAKEYPSVSTMAQTFAESIVQWAKKGFKVVNEEQYNQRLNICRGCDLFDEKALGGNGRCRECGCATQAKLRIATERCPIDKWVQV